MENSPPCDSLILCHRRMLPQLWPACRPFCVPDRSYRFPRDGSCRRAPHPTPPASPTRPARPASPPAPVPPPVSRVPFFLGFPGFSGFMVGSVMVFSPDWSSIRRFQLPNGRRVHVQFGGDLTRLRPTGRDRDHRLASQLLGYWPVAQPVLAGGEPVDPRGEQRLALRITQTPHHACHVTSVRETVIDRRAFLPIRVTKPMRAMLDGSPVVRSRPGPGTMPSATVPTGIRAHESRSWN